MGRRYYRRRTVTVRPKKKWATNLDEWQQTIQQEVVFEGPKVIFFNHRICSNSAQSTTPNPTIIKFGNVKAKGDFSFNMSIAGSNVSALGGKVFIVYVP